MLSIGRIAKLAQVSSRTLRHYETLGLVSAASRGNNGYRYFTMQAVEKVRRIRDLQGLGFSLEEIRDILSVSDPDFIESLGRKLAQVEAEIADLSGRRERLLTLLSVSRKIDSRDSLTETERRQYMEAIQDEIIRGLKARCGKVTDGHLGYLARDWGIREASRNHDLLRAVRKCVEFARSRNLTLGPGRGGAGASLALFGLGFTDVDPFEHQLIPERLWDSNADIHIDVEFERGQEFIEYCREVSKGLTHGQIHAFKMPLLDIINRVHERLGGPIDYRGIPDDSDVVLAPFRSGDIEKVFLFDMSERALVMKYEDLLPDYQGTEKISEYLKAQKIHGFRDVANITALWRPHCEEMIRRIEGYREAKIRPQSHDFLSPGLRESLQPNFGQVIYHEDLIRIIAAYSGWSLARANQFRRGLFLKKPDVELELREFRRLAPAEVCDLVTQEAPWTFCQPHMVAFTRLTKQTAVLKALHAGVYLEEVERWEQKNGFVWDDIGIRIPGVALLQ